MSNEDIYANILDDMHALYIAKNKDYGNSVHNTYVKYGMTSFLVRMEDKLNRIKTITENGINNVSDEKIIDTLVDLANYSLLAIIEYKLDKNV